MNPVSTRLCVVLGCLFALISRALAQETLDPKRVQWTTPLSGNVLKTLVDARGNVWSLSASNNFQVIGPDGKTRWTKAVSALTVSDFAVDATGQLVLLGSSAGGPVVAERYDASQTRLWSNRLDSLSGETSQLSLALTGTGSSVAFGTNARNSQRISYYFIRANGSLGTFATIEADKAGPVNLIRPVVFNRNEVAFGVDQPAVADAVPIYYRLKVDSAAIDQKPTSSFNSRYQYLSLAYGSQVNEPVSFKSLPLLTDGRYVNALVQARYDRVSTSPAGTTTVQGNAVQPIISPFAYDEPYFYAYQSDLFKKTVISKIAASLSLLQVDRSTYVTAQTAVSTGTNASAANITINQYQVQPILNSPGPYLTDSLQVGMAYSAQQAGSGKTVQQITLLRRGTDGTLLLAGATSGTMVIGTNRFVGTSDSPAHFLVAIGPGQVKQQLTSEQVQLSTTLPASSKQVLTNKGRRIWVQLTDSTFRAYDSQGNSLWEKQLDTGKNTSAGVDDLNNLYVADAASVSMYDSTGIKQWTINANVKIDGAYRTSGHRLAIKPGGGGIWTDIYQASGNALRAYGYRLVINEFTVTGQVINEASYANGYPVFSSLGVQQVPVRTNERFTLVLNDGFYKTISSNQSLLINYLPGRVDTQPVARLGGYPTDVINSSGYSFGLSGAQVVWAESDKKNRIYTSVRQVFTYASDIINQYTFFTLDSAGNKVAAAVGTPFAYRMATAAAQAVTPDGVILSLASTVRTTSAQSTTLNLVLSEYASTYALRNTIQLGMLIQTTGQTAATTFEIVKAYADGTILLTGVATGMLTMGSFTVTGSVASPARFLVRLSPYLLATNVPTTPICAGTSALLTAQLKGYLEQPARLEVSPQPNASKPTSLSLALPISQSAVVDTTLSAISLPVPLTLAAGTYWLRLSSGSLTSAWQSLTVLAAPASPTATQQGDELVAAGGSQYQWYDSRQQVITGAIDSRFRPQAAGSYYVVSRANGCQSAPSAAVVYVITATEPLTELTIYPNPTTDRLWVRWPGAGTNPRIHLLDAQGRMLLDIGRQGEVTELPIRELTTGAYLLRLSAEGRAAQVRKVLIQ